jgi:hypothetical protein
MVKRPTTCRNYGEIQMATHPARSGTPVGGSLALMISALALASCVSAAGPRIATQTLSSAAPTLFVHASLFTGTGAGGSWDLTLTAASAAHAGEDTAPRLNPAFSVFLRATIGDRGMRGTVIGEFSMQADYVARVHRAIETEQFFELPAYMDSGSGYLHQPHLTLKIDRGTRTHTVRVHDPARLKNDARARRFLRVWAALYERLPMRPSWREE